MKTARFLLACAAACTLAACGSDITAPTSARSVKQLPTPRHDTTTGDSGQMGTGTATSSPDQTTNITVVGCVPVLVVNSDGSVGWQCVINGSAQMGTGS